MTKPHKGPEDSFYEALFSTAEEAMVVADKETGEIVAANAQVERLTRRRSGELLGKRIGEMWTDSEPSDEPRKASLRAGDGTRIEASISTRELEADGRRYIQYTIEPEPDVARYQQTQLLHELVDNFDDSVLITDLEGKIVYINKKGLLDLGYDLSEVVGKQASVLQDPDTFREVGSRMLQAAQNNQVWIGETTVLTKDGSQLHAHVNAFMARDRQGEPMALVAIAREVSSVEIERRLKLFQSIVDHASESIFMLDSDGRITFMNTAGLERLGRTKEELVGEHVSLLQDPADFEEKGKRILESVMAGKGWSGETFARKKTGERYPVHLTSFPVMDSAGSVIAAVGITSDISHLREAERKAALLSEIIENASQGVFTLDPEGSVTYINKAGLDRLGRTYEDVIGKHFSTLADTEASEGKLEAMVRALEEGSPWFDEVTAMKKTGERYSVEITAFPVRNAEGKLTAVVGTSADITRLREAESQAKRLAAVVESSADMICITDPNGRITYANRAMLQLTQMPREELLGASPADFIFPKESGAGFETIITSTKEAGYEGEVEWRAGDGSVRTLWIRAFRVDDPTTAKASLVYIFTDVTEQRWLRRELERRHAHAEAINKMAFALRELLSTEEVLGRSLEVGIDVTGADVGGIYFLEGETERLRLAAWHGASSEAAERLRTVKLTKRLRDVLYQFKTATARDDLSTLGDGQGKRMAVEGFRSGIMSPLWSHGRPIGAMFLATTEPRTFDSQDLDLATSLGSIVAAASERARLFEEARDSATRLSLMSDAQKAVLSKMSVDEIIKGVGEHIQRLFPSSVVGLALVDETGENLVFERVALDTAPAPGQPSEHRVDEMAASLAIHQRRPVVRKDLRTEKQRFSFDEQCIRDGILSSLVVPLVVGEKVIGTLNVGAREVGAFSEDDVPLAEEIANVVAVAIDNARLYSELEATARRLALAGEVGRDVLSTLSADEILGEIAAWAMRILPCERVSLALLDSSGLNFSIKMASTDRETSVGEGEVIPVSDTILGLAIRSDEPTLVRMSEAGERFPVEGRLATEGIECAIAAPLRVRDKVIGTLNAGSREPCAFTKEHFPAMVELADLAAMALEKARVYEAEIKRSETLEALRDTAERLLDPTGLDEKFLAVMRCVRDSLGFDGGSIALVSDDGRHLIRRSRFDSARGERPAEDEAPLSRDRMSASSQAIYSRSPIIVDDPLSDPRCADTRDDIRADGTKRFVNIPILVGDKAIGVICCDRTVSDALITEEDVELLEILAQQTGLAIQNSNLLEETQRAYQELKGAQEARISAERMTALGQMAREMAHDINNLLSVIAARCEFVLDDEISDEVRTHVHAAHEKAMEAAERVRRMQDATRTRKAVEFEPIDLNTLAQEAVWITEGRWRFRAARDGVHYEMETDFTATRYARGTEGELKQVVIDLVYNALDRNPAGGKIRIETRDQDGKVVCAVVDPASVPAQGELDSLFEPFSGGAGDDDADRRSLSVAKGTVERHGGKIEVEPKGDGTAFAVSLTAADPIGAPVGRRVREKGPPAGAEAPPLRILVVEDEPQVRDLMAKMLNSLGHQTEPAEDGEQALGKMRETDFDVIVTDLGLPGIDGWEVARKAKDLSDRLAVVLITGWGDQISDTEIERSAVDAVVVKPFTKKKLKDAISDALTKKS